MKQTKYSVLCIEDDPNMGKLITDYLNSRDYLCRLETDAPEALQYALNALPDVILLDLYLPSMHGFDVLKKLKRQPLTSEIPVIIVSAASHPESIVQGLHLGAVDYITKPFELAELSARIYTRLKLQELQRIERRKKIEESNPIFVSYKRSDWATYVSPLVQRLREEELPIWIDQDLIEGSSDWLDEINRALKKASCILVCVSPAAMESRYVKMEYRYAFNNGKPIYPVICANADLPAELQILQHYAYDDTEKLVDSLKRNQKVSKNTESSRN